MAKDELEDRLEEALFKEVDEEVRRDRYAEIWKKYGNFIMVGALAVVLGTAGAVWWRDSQATKRGQLGMTYAAAVSLAQGGKTKEAIKAFADLAAKSGGGYGTLAQLHEAALRAQSGDVSGAVKVYEAIAADGDADPILRDLARIQGVLAAFDTAKPSELSAKLQPLIKTDGPWRYIALELTGMLAQKGGDEKKAREIFTRLVDDAQAPATVRTRARAMLGMLGPS